MDLAMQGIPVKGSITCEGCMTRHEIQDIITGKLSTPQQQDGARPQNSNAVERAASSMPVKRLYLGAIGMLMDSIDSFLFLIWGVFGQEFIPQWFVWQVADQGLSLMLLRGLSLIMIGLGLTATYWFKPQLWYLAGLLALILVIRIVVFWFLGEQTLFGGANTLSEGLVVWLVYGIRWLPIYPVMVFCLMIGALQLKTELGAFLSRIIFWSGNVFIFSVVINLLGFSVPLFTEFPIGEIASLVCFAFCGVALFQLSRRRIPDVQGL